MMVVPTGDRYEDRSVVLTEGLVGDLMGCLLVVLMEGLVGDLMGCLLVVLIEGHCGDHWEGQMVAWIMDLTEDLKKSAGDVQNVYH